MKAEGSKKGVLSWKGSKKVEWGLRSRGVGLPKKKKLQKTGKNVTSRGKSQNRTVVGPIILKSNAAQDLSHGERVTTQVEQIKKGDVKKGRKSPWWPDGT